jgi:peroxiredoxin
LDRVPLRIGDEAPDFSLPDTQGKPTPLNGEGAPATVVVFTCNHCPYALAWHERLNRVAREYESRGVRTLQISSNDPERYPRDSLEAMRERVDAGDFATPYLFDESQEVARAYEARTTPHVFVLDADQRLAYQGAPDADYRNESLDAEWLRDALDATLKGQRVPLSETEPVGCSIKWRQ